MTEKKTAPGPAAATSSHRAASGSAGGLENPRRTPRLGSEDKGSAPPDAKLSTSFIEGAALMASVEATCHLDACPDVPAPWTWCGFDRVIDENPLPTNICSAGAVSEREVPLGTTVITPLTSVCTYVNDKLVDALTIPALLQSDVIQPEDQLCEHIHGNGTRQDKWIFEEQLIFLPACAGCTCEDGVVSALQVLRVREIGAMGAGTIESRCRRVCDAFGPCCPAPPVAVITGPEGVLCAQDPSTFLVNFDGSLSKGENLTYSWKVDGQEIGTSPNLSHGLGEGIHEVQLTVRDICAASTDTTTVEIRPLPKAVISGGESIVCTSSPGGTASVDLTGSGSTGSISSYQWTLSGPSPKADQGITFTASDLEPGAYTATLTVFSEECEAQDSTSFSFTVSDPQPVIKTVVPCLETASSLVQVTLDGRNSTDPAGLPLAFAWTISPEAPIQNPEGPSASVMLPAGDHVVTLTVTAGPCSHSTSTVIHVTGFVAQMGDLDDVFCAPTEGDRRALVSFPATGTSFTDEPITYTWTITSPKYSTSLIGPSEPSPSDRFPGGVYQVQLEASQPGCPPRIFHDSFRVIDPHAVIDPLSSPLCVVTTQGTVIQLNGSNSHEDSGLSLTYEWRFRPTRALRWPPQDPHSRSSWDPASTRPPSRSRVEPARTPPPSRSGSSVRKSPWSTSPG
jgi:hypothetical protein